MDRIVIRERGTLEWKEKEGKGWLLIKVKELPRHNAAPMAAYLSQGVIVMKFNRVCEWEKGNGEIDGREEVGGRKGQAIEQRIRHLPHQRIN